VERRGEEKRDQMNNTRGEEEKRDASWGRQDRESTQEKTGALGRTLTDELDKKKKKGEERSRRHRGK